MGLELQQGLGRIFFKSWAASRLPTELGNFSQVGVSASLPSLGVKGGSEVAEDTVLVQWLQMVPFC